MTPAELDRILDQTLADRSLSRGERKALREVIEGLEPTEADRAALGARAFARARAAIDDPRAREVLDWLEEVVKVVRPAGAEGAGAGDALAEALFSPGDACWRRIAALVGAAKSSVDVCVFTITDQRVSDPLLAAHRRGVRVRVVTDNDKANDLGSDVDDLARAGVPVAVDTSPYHMHHKFALFDDRALLTGSYNWTRGAAEMNEENVVISGDPRLIRPFRAEFDRLWKLYARQGRAR
jgi:phosphatidylserine/phosphatidylglycerophosphate/cardiolipin synthase-like enzyme